MRKKLCALVLILLGLQLTSFQVIEDKALEPILTPSAHRKKTVKLRLENGLEAYIISDPTLSQSAAALSVNVGLWHDPDAYPGMAHFVEHMLFMGSQTYPEENDYSSFIRDHAGADNAFTTTDRTLYVFSIETNALEEALKRFSRFFIDPLFSSSAVEREILAVDEEYQLNKGDESWKKWMVLKATGNQNHPNSRFAIGNKETLRNIPPEALKKWHEEHYSADKMHLVLLSPLPEEKLCALAEELFSPIRKNEQPPPSFTAPLLAETQKGKMLFLQSEREGGRLQLIWEITLDPSDGISNSAKELVAFALDHPLKNSLSYALQRKKLANQVDLFIDALSQHHALFTIQIDLTDKGIEEMTTAISCCFQALARLKEGGTPAFLYEEMEKITQLAYQYPYATTPFDTVLMHADNLIDEELATYPEKTLLCQGFSSHAVKNFAQSLTAKECLYLLEFDAESYEIALPYREKWTQTEYGYWEIQPSTLTSWDEASIHPAIEYPYPNPYLPKSPISFQNAQDRPITLLEDHPDRKIYFQQDSAYLVPELSLLFDIRFPLLTTSAETQASLWVFVHALNQQLSPSTYFAQLAGIDYSFTPRLATLELAVHGYADPASLFAQELFRQLDHVSPSEELFDQIKEKLFDRFSSQDLLEEAKNTLYETLLPHQPTLEEKLEALEELSYEAFQLFCQTLFTEHRMIATLYGYIEQEEAKELCQKLASHLPPTPSLTDNRSTPSSIKSSTPGKRILIEVSEEEEEGCVALLAQQINTYTLPHLGAHKILSLALNQAFFDTLRNQQQTGYIVTSWSEHIGSDLFECFAVHSSYLTPKELFIRFEAFITHYRNHLETLISQERFATLKTSILAEIEHPADNLQEHAHLLHKLATQKQANFHWKKELMASIEELDYNAFLHFAHQGLSASLM